MAATTAPASSRLRTPAIIDVVLAVAIVAVLAWAELLTPAFTDFEAEAEPAFRALLAGDWSGGLAALPLYGGALLIELPFAALADALGGGDLAVYRAVAIPGALGMAWMAWLAAHWLRAAGRPRIEQLAALGAIAASPCLALSWSFGHHEEALVTAAALAGILLVLRGDRTGFIAGGLIVGLAFAGKPSAGVLVPVALVAASSLRGALITGAAAAVGAAALLAPMLSAQARQFSDGLQAAGGGEIFTPGTVWWFFGAPNPDWVDPSGADGGVLTLNTSANSARITPEWLGTSAHELIAIFALVLAAAWWLRMRPWQSTRPATNELVASALLLAAAAVWWRGLLDPWFQSYYLVAALVALVLADARRGRLPLAGLLAWAGFWLTHGHDAPAMSLHPDARTAISLAWMVPLGVWLIVAAMRRPATPVTA